MAWWRWGSRAEQSSKDGGRGPEDHADAHPSQAHTADRRQGQSGDRLTLILIAGTLPGVIAGSVIRIELLPGPRVFDLMVAAVLIAAGYSAVAREAIRRRRSGPARHV
jgi:hypothetical protein